MDPESNEPNNRPEPINLPDSPETIDTPQSFESTTFEPGLNKPNKKRKIIIIVAIVVVILLLAGGGVAWALFGQNQQGEKAQQNNSQVSQDVEDDKDQEVPLAVLPSDVISKIQTKLGYNYTLTSRDAIGQGELRMDIGNNSPVYKSDGYDFYTSYIGGSSLSLVGYRGSSEDLPGSAERSVRNTIIGIYVEFGLVKKETLGDEYFAREIYTGEGLVCSVYSPNSPTSPTDASCGEISKYKPISEAVAPFAKAISSKDKSLYIGEPTIKSSAVSGYQKASMGVSSVVGVGGYVALFYKKDGGEWKYFTGTQQIIPCSKYNTVDIRNAFNGEKCWDDNTNKEKVVGS